MGYIDYENPEWGQSLYWQFDPRTGWEGYHEQLDEIVAYAKTASEPFILVFHPQGDVPKGNPMNHMQRIIKISKNEKNILQTIVIMQSSWFVAKAFVRIINRVMSLEPDVMLIFSMEEAKAIHAKTLAEQQEAEN